MIGHGLQSSLAETAGLLSKRLLPWCGPAFLTLLIAAAASARNADGLLDIIRTPNDGIPVLLVSGGSFEAVVTGEVSLSLESEGTSHALGVAWTDLPGGRKKAVCTVPAGVAPGTYALRAQTGDRTDVNVRSVFIRDAFPDSYTFAHVTDTHIGSDRNPRTSEDILRDVIQAVNATGAAFVLVTGDLTESGDAEQFRKFIEILDTCTLPTFVCAGNHDRQALHYENAFGPDAYMFWFGPDGYLSFDTKDFNVADDLGDQAADLEIFRRAIKPARWAIGFSHRYEPDMGMRAQIALFIDDPLDWFIFGHWHRANTAQEKTVPWGEADGATRITVTPAAINGAIRQFDVAPSGITPREVQDVAATK